jgi:phage terminase large subunit-like protein
MRLNSLAAKLAETLADGGWRAKARASQLPPPGDWDGWLILAGRGFGKTRSGSEWIKELAETATASRIALVGPTAYLARTVMVEGESGILSVSSPWCRPIYGPSKRQLSWPNGVIASISSAEEPDQLRGPQYSHAWGDEVAAWPNAQDAWDQLQFCLRLGPHPQWLTTTTPRPIKLIKDLLARQGSGIVVTRGSTLENEANLPAAALASLRARYENTRIGRQELNAELLLDVAGALWTRDMLERANEKCRLPDLKRVVVAVDPSGTRGQEDGGDSVGIVVAGLGVDGLGYVLADRTCKLSPDGWGRVAVNAYREFKADRIVAERNFGGAMVEHVIRTVDRNASYKEVTASRGKIARAEPIAALYEQNRVRHVGLFTELEDQMAAMTGDGYSGDGSPDRCDALVWALSELMTAPMAPAPVFGTYSRSFATNQFGQNSGSGNDSAGEVYASQPAAYWAAKGIFHSSDREMWIRKGVYVPPEAKEKVK